MFCPMVIVTTMLPFQEMFIFEETSNCRNRHCANLSDMPEAVSRVVVMASLVQEAGNGKCTEKSIRQR